jgi:hypothetical protein
MSEFVYKLDLPPLDTILLEPNKLFSNSITFNQYAPKDILKPEWLNWQDLSWDFSLFFYKTDGDTGIIHIDGPGVWGINWVYNGYGKMDFWNLEEVETTYELTSLSTPRYRCATKTKPIKTYNTDPGAYLVNASIPHRATGYNQRYTLSLRSYSSKLSWLQAVNKFKNLMI